MAEEQKQIAGSGHRGLRPPRHAPRQAAGIAAARRGHGGPRREVRGGPGGQAVVRAGRPRGKRQYFRKKKVCKFCVEKMDFIDYKRADILSQFVQERGKILPRRMTGVCSRHQRWLGEAIKRARNIALLPFAGSAAGSCRPARPRSRRRRCRTCNGCPPAQHRRRLRHQPLRSVERFVVPERLTRLTRNNKDHEPEEDIIMQIILQEDVEKLGHRGDVVTVKPGYARNFLLPRKLGVEASAGNMKAIEKIRTALAKKTATEMDAAQKHAAALNGVELNFTRKTGENDQMFGSVTTGDIAEGLQAQGFKIDKRQIQPAEPIKVIGERDVTIKVFRDVTASVKVTVGKEE